MQASAIASQRRVHTFQPTVIIVRIAGDVIKLIFCALECSIIIVDIADRIATAVEPGKCGQGKLAAIVVLIVRGMVQRVMDAAYPIEGVIIILCAGTRARRRAVRIAISVYAVARVVSPVLHAAGGHAVALQLIKRARIVTERLPSAIGIINARHAVVAVTRDRGGVVAFILGGV